MSTVDRRTFLKMVGAPAVGAALPASLDKALAIPANNKTGSIRDVEHVIILMQENRSFDHYFGTLRGVRGFGDPHPVTLPSGKDVWHQPDGDGELLPFRPEVKDLGQTFLPDPPHGWNDGHAAWNEGRFDQWVPNKGVTAMTYHTRQDLAYHYALADAFTVCDSYHCSLMGPTDPNRYHMWSGWVGNDGRGGGPVITNAEAGYDWSTYPERLERNGVSWKIYQDVGTGLTAAGSWGWTNDPYIGNYGDNSLLYFHQYQNAKPGTPLADRAKTGTEVRTQGRDPEALLADFRADVEAGRLPQVSWITAPEAYTEHPNWEPAYGSWYISQVIDILAANPEVWSKMALFITYDEEGGFFDHVVPPTPPQTREQGLSTVPTTNEIFPGDAGHPAGPYGLGIRVPMIIVSPWTRGGWVNSEVFDHTSLIKFLETRFGAGRPDLVESNITPWRRAVVGDLTSAFDFRTPNRDRNVRLPDTDDFKPADLVRHPDEVPVPPVDQRLPKQERGVRPARALPYTLHATGRSGRDGFRIDFRNTGGAGAVFQVREAGSADAPRTYTVEPGRQLTDTWPSRSGHDLSVHGPNGFFRRFTGGRNAADLEITPSYDEHGYKLVLDLVNHGSKRVEVTVRDGYHGRPVTLSVRPGATERAKWTLERTHGWYDLTVTVAGDPGFAHRYAGHVENGRDSISDPALGGLV
ncbi:phosphocholine-specific phospholipase C [Micromonospora krabiensis]|uniref:phospholipase C n=1 Tax=Micromonospora krabiensis TaxID=307121 RepID=A0A1C3MZG0_9ACTN|nr:phospholipase C, phosphocholine-specific [Micromonospora krabiensis]SBV25722.1 phospholipase C [Micromonospora krabiensis]